MQGKTFRPSDWAERLAGVMSQFRPGGAQPGKSSQLFTLVHSQRAWAASNAWWFTLTCATQSRMAWEFCMNFAKDNELQVFEAWMKPDDSDT